MRHLTGGWWRVAAALAVLAPAVARAQGLAAEGPPPRRTLDILEYSVEGSTQLSALELEEALQPFLGPGRALEDVEGARTAIEKLYTRRGYQSVAVAVPPQTVRSGVVRLQVTEGKVGRLRVRGSRYFSLHEIRRQAPSVAEGKVPNFDELVRDIVALNQLPDRRVTPVVRAGAVPGTVDVDLTVQDTLPAHGSLEYNNRYSTGTTKPRLNGSLRYDNLWQAGHSLNFAFQLAPQRPKDAEVFSGSYLARFPDAPWLSLSASGMVQESDVSTLGSIAVKGRSRVFGGRATFTLPGSSSFFHSLSSGVDYKRFQETLTLGGSPLQSPIHYFPWSAQYGATWSGDAFQMGLTVTLVATLRALGSGEGEFDNKRYRASGSFLYSRAELTRTQELGGGFQLWGRAGGQVSPVPLVSAEQLTAGGSESVRGYLDGQAAGDTGVSGTLEVRSPVVSGWAGKRVLDDWRLLAFLDAGRLWVRETLPEQRASFSLRSVGAGTRLRLFDRVGGAIDVGVPLLAEGATARYRPRTHLRFWTEF